MSLIQKVIPFVLILIASSSGCGHSVTVESERAKFQGKWEVVAWQMKGQKFTAGNAVGSQYEFEGEKFRVIIGYDKTGPWRRYKLNVDSSPALLIEYNKTIMPDKSQRDSTTESSYRIVGDELKICPLRDTIVDGKSSPTIETIVNGITLFLKKIPRTDPKEEQLRHRETDKRKQESALYGLQPMVSDRINGKYDVDFFQSSFTRNVVPTHWQKIMDLHDIRKLVFRACRGVGDEEMQNVGKLTSLEALNLNATDVGDDGIQKLLNLNNLHSLDLSFTAVTDAGIVKLAEIQSLKDMVLNGSPVTSKGIDALKEKRPDLRIVWHRHYTRQQQKAASALAQLRLDIGDDVDPFLKPEIVTCQIVIPPYVKLKNISKVEKGSPPPLEPQQISKYIEQLPAPTAVAVAHQGMDDSIFDYLKNIQGLVRLELGVSRVTDEGIAKLKGERSLRYLSMTAHAKITKASMLVLTSLSNLETIGLYDLGLKPDDLEPLFKLEKLKCLIVDRSELTRDQVWKIRQKGVKVEGWR